MFIVFQPHWSLVKKEWHVEFSPLFFWPTMYRVSLASDKNGRSPPAQNPTDSVKLYLSEKTHPSCHSLVFFSFSRIQVLFVVLTWFSVSPRSALGTLPIYNCVFLMIFIWYKYYLTEVIFFSRAACEPPGPLSVHSIIIIIIDISVWESGISC